MGLYKMAIVSPSILSKYGDFNADITRRWEEAYLITAALNPQPNVAEVMNCSIVLLNLRLVLYIALFV